MRRGSLVIVALIAACGRREAPSERDLFAETLRDRVVAAGGPALRYDRADFSLFLPGDGGPSQLVSLRNLHDEVMAAPPAERAARIDVIVRMIVTTSGQGTPKLERERLLPTVRENLYFQSPDLERHVRAGGAPFTLASRPLTELLAVGLVLDYDDQMTLVSAETVGSSWDELYAVALANLGQRSTEAFESPSPGVFVSPWRDNHDAARLLLTDVVRRPPVKGQPVALIPSRDTLIITGADDERALLAAADLVDQALARPRPLSGAALRLAGDHWEHHIPSLTPSVKARYQLLDAQARQGLYDEQAAALQKALGDDIYVAKLMVHRQPDQSILTTAVLTRGVRTWLPRADRVSFVDLALPDADKVLGFAPWERAREVMGLVPDDLGPARYRVERWPTPDELRRLSLTQ